MKREDSLLNLICFVAAAGFFALIAYDLIAGGSIISTDGLFFIVVPLVFALSFLAAEGITFTVIGPAPYERLTSLRDSGAVAV